MSILAKVHYGHMTLVTQQKISVVHSAKNVVPMDVTNVSTEKKGTKLVPFSLMRLNTLI